MLIQNFVKKVGMKFGFVKIAAVTPALRAGDAKHNAKAIIAAITDAHAKGCQIAVMPELCITGATCGSAALQRASAAFAEKCLLDIAAETKGRDILAVVGLPLRIDDGIFNVSAAIADGRVAAIVPKRGGRGFQDGTGLGYDSITVGRYAVPFGQMIFRNALDNDLNIAIVAGRDISDLAAVSSLASAGANLILNPAAQISLLGDGERLQNLKALSSCLKCGVVSVSAGEGESVSDGVYSGEKFIIENGTVLASGGRSVPYVVSDIDTEVLYNARTVSPLPRAEKKYPCCDITVPQGTLTLDRSIAKLPYVPKDPGQYQRALDILAQGLFDRSRAIGAERFVVGVSGGTDSTAVMLALSHMCDKFGVPSANIVAVTMPGPASTTRTQGNAQKLIKLLGATHVDAPITEAVKAHLKQIGCADFQSVTAENAQARERTQILLDIANDRRGFVIGTSDMSEIALGWSTYGGDQLAHFNCNASLTKTFIKALLRHLSFYTDNKQLANLLADILNTPVSPELKKGQVTENIIGPYELHDFFLYNMILLGFSPKKTLWLAETAFPDYSATVIKKTLKTFITRFFANQFKKNAGCDGIRLSPFDVRDFKINGDLSAETYLAQL